MDHLVWMMVAATMDLAWVVLVVMIGVMVHHNWGRWGMMIKMVC